MNETIEDQFKCATKYVESVASKLDNEKLLYLYARYKQVKEGACLIPKPGMFDFQGKRKWEAWKKLENMSRSQAMTEYVSFVSSIDAHWTEHKPRTRSSSGSRPSGLGVSVSTMLPTEDQLADQDKTVFDWCKEGNIDKVRESLKGTSVDVNQLDDEGLALLHWSSDRGNKDMVEFLLSVDADINVRDCDGQTPLHYAVSCEHGNVVSLLVSKGADVNIIDNDDMKPIDFAPDSLKSILQQCSIKR